MPTEPIPPVPSSPAPPAEARPVAHFRDPLPWARPVWLSGVLERQQFHPILAAFLVFVGGFLLYQIVGAVVAAALVVIELQQGGGISDPSEVMSSLAEHAGALLGGNALGQVAGFLVLVLLAVRLHTPDVWSYLRVRRPDTLQLLLGAAGLVVLLPLVSWVGSLNKLIPLPESLLEWDAQQAALIEQVLGGGVNVFLALLLVAITPAVCEEVMFRGYLQRQVERRFGARWSIVGVGVLFGAFHLRFTEVLPLALLGIYLGFAVWVTGSLWVGMLVHLLNNGLAVVVSDYVQRRPDLDPVALEQVDVPWYLAVVSLLLGLAVCRALLHRRAALLGAAAPPGTSSRIPSDL